MLEEEVRDKLAKYEKEKRREKAMKKGTFIGIVALVVAAIGVIIALAAYFKNKTNYLYDEDDFMFDDPEDLDYYDFDHVGDKAEDAVALHPDGVESVE